MFVQNHLKNRKLLLTTSIDMVLANTMMVKIKHSSNSNRFLLIANKNAHHLKGFKTTSEQESNVASAVSEMPVTACPYHKNVSNNKEIKAWTQVPGPKPWPLIGNLIDIQKNASNTSEYFLSLCDQYGDLVKLTVLNTNMLIIANPYHLSELFKKEDRRKPLESTRYYKDSRGIEISPVEMAPGEDWNPVRQLFNIAMKPEFQENVTIPQLTELNGDFLRRLVKHLQKVPESDKFKFVDNVEATSRYAFDAVLKTFLGVRMTDEIVNSLPFDIRDFVKYSVAGLDMALVLDNKPPLYKLFKTREYKNFEHVWDKSFEYARYCIQRFKKNPSENQRLLELLEERARDQKNAAAKVEAVMIGFLQAGTDITVRMLNMNLYRLAHHTEYQEKIYKESVEIFGEPTIEELTGENGLLINMEKFKKLKHTKNFIEEVLRLNSFSYLTMGRQLSQDTEIGGYMVPKDTIVLAMQRWANLKDEYVPRGNEFIPERHEKGSPLAPVNNFVSIPFGVGARKCPGSRIASTEIHFGLINAVRHFKISHENQNVFPPSSFDQSLLYIDSDKYPLYFTPRDHVKEYVENNSRKL